MDRDVLHCQCTRWFWLWVCGAATTALLTIVSSAAA